MTKSDIDGIHIAILLVGFLLNASLISIGFVTQESISVGIFLAVAFIIRCIMYVYHELKLAGRI